MYTLGFWGGAKDYTIAVGGFLLHKTASTRSIGGGEGVDMSKSPFASSSVTWNPC